MFDPAWDEGCPGCTYHVNSMGDISMLKERNTRFVLISRAPLAKLVAYKKARDWKLPWYSSFGTDFNYDFHVTNDAKVAPIEYNYRNKAELDAAKPPSNLDGEEHGLSVFALMMMCSTPTQPTRGQQSAWPTLGHSST